MDYFRFLGRALPAVIVIALLAILGNIALIRTPRKSAAPLTILPRLRSPSATLARRENAIVGLGPLTIAADMAGPSAITTATLMLDGQVIDAAISSQSPPLTQTIRAELPGLTQGPHNVEVKASLESGRSKRTEWQFRVTAGEEPTAVPTPEPTATAIPAPTQVSTFAAPVFDGQRPAPGDHILAGATSVPLSVLVTSEQPLDKVVMLLDGAELSAQTQPVSGKDGAYRVSAIAPRIDAGEHRLRVETTAGSASGATEWTFAGVAQGEL